MNIKVSELFYSIQGEGRYMGVPSVFLRTFGCNFTCDGFGMAKGMKSTERDFFAANVMRYKDYKELPLAGTGCDSYASWDSRFKDLSPMVEIDGLVDNITELLPYNEWRDEHLVITGGEPLLGWQRAYPELLGHEKMKKLKHLTFETNGTQMLTTEFASWLHREFHHDRGIHSVTFSISPKLSVSGEKREDAIKPEVVAQLDEYGYAYLKFVVATEEDVTEALEVTEIYRNEGFEGPVYLMPLGGIESTYNLNKTQVANLALKYGLRYSDRLHVPLFKNQWGT